MNGSDLPEFHELGVPAVRLLQGVLYDDDETTWQILLANESDLTTYFARIGLALVIDRGEGLAYLGQLTDDQRTGGYERLPRLFRRTPLGYPATLLCVLLRDEYRRFEDEDLDNERCVVETAALLDAWKAFFPAASDEVQLRKKLLATLNKLEDLKFVRSAGPGDEAWEVRKLLKARLPLDALEDLRDQLMKAENP
ncbi:MAG: DUF4194 domain-containing protein [Patescibacteria group bacterium]|nr:DUF4194 domain-containing protein [Patescibacteria group bacterium]